MTAFLAAFVDLLASVGSDLPVALALDHNHLRSLQHDFQLLHFLAACRYTFKRILVRLGFSQLVPHTSCDDLARRIIAITRAPDVNNDRSSQQQAVALEISRSAHDLCKAPTLSVHETVERARQVLQEACEPKSPASKSIATEISSQLRALSEDEVQAIKHLSPPQIANRHIAQAKIEPSKNEAAEETAMLRHVAKRSAHIAVIHWRVWAPILYLNNS